MFILEVFANFLSFTFYIKSLSKLKRLGGRSVSVCWLCLASGLISSYWNCDLRTINPSASWNIKRCCSFSAAFLCVTQMFSWNGADFLQLLPWHKAPPDCWGCHRVVIWRQPSRWRETEIWRGDWHLHCWAKPSPALTVGRLQLTVGAARIKQILCP